jgi:hypothetical protein
MKKTNERNSSRKISAAAILLASLVFCSVANGQEKLLDFYICKDELSANRCQRDCEKSKEEKRSFKTNKDEKAVLEVDYKGQDKVASRVWKSCVIFDEQNWDCSSYVIDHTPGYNVNKKFKMINGVFTKYEEWQERNVMFEKWSKQSYCAK